MATVHLGETDLELVEHGARARISFYREDGHLLQLSEIAQAARLAYDWGSIAAEIARQHPETVRVSTCRGWRDAEDDA